MQTFNKADFLQYVGRRFPDYLRRRPRNLYSWEDGRRTYQEVGHGDNEPKPVTDHLAYMIHYHATLRHVVGKWIRDQYRKAHQEERRKWGHPPKTDEEPACPKGFPEEVFRDILEERERLKERGDGVHGKNSCPNPRFSV